MFLKSRPLSVTIFLEWVSETHILLEKTFFSSLIKKFGFYTSQVLGDIPQIFPIVKINLSFYLSSKLLMIKKIGLGL